jgi:threonine dehydrogenase-like Zn-dependent dehydrogenase
VRALTWAGVNEVEVREVPDPRILNDGDVILRVLRSAACGSDLHLLGGYIPFM